MFLVYNPCCNKGDRVGGSVAQRAILDEWIATVTTYLRNMERQGGHRRKLYGDRKEFFVTVATRQLVGNVSSVLKARELNYLYLLPA